MVDVCVAVGFAFRRRRLRARTEPTTTINMTPTTPPITQGSHPESFPAVSLKLEGTEIKMTVVLSCPPREFASSTSAREASFKLDLERTTSRISSFHNRSVKPSLHKSRTSLGNN